MKKVLLVALAIQGVVVMIDFIMGAHAGFFNAYALWQETLFRFGFSLNREIPFIFLQNNGNDNAFVIAWLFFGLTSFLLSYSVNLIIRRLK